MTIIVVLQFVGTWQEGYCQNADPSAIKASWIDHFTKFIEWPNISDTTKTFVIKVIGDDELDGYLNRIYDQRTIKSIPVKIEFVDDVDQIGFCHILYISESRKKSLDQIFDTINVKPILTIGSTYGYAQDGVIINFYNDGNKIRFEFNISASKRNELDVSFRLLEIAKIVKQN